MAPVPDGSVDTGALLAAIVQSTSDAVISVDLRGVITSWNHAAELLYGWAGAEAIGQHNRLIIPPDRFAEEDDVIRRVRQRVVVPTFETVRVRKDGSRVDVLMTSSAIRDVADSVIGVSKISRDMSFGRAAVVTSRRLASIVESSDDAIISKFTMRFKRSRPPQTPSTSAFTPSSTRR